MKNICIVGGGASGLLASIFAAKNSAKVTLFEGNSETGSKILKTGNGKCNFSNLNMSENMYICDDPQYVKTAFDKFSNNDLIYYLTSLGLLIKEKSGYLYPYNEQAKSIRNILEAEALSLGVNLRKNCFVNMVSKDGEGFLISITGQKEREKFDKVILATGGKAGLTSKDRENGYDILNSLSLSTSKLYPGLTKLICEGMDFEFLKGVRTACNVSLFIEDEPLRTENGELIFWEKGISGICVFSLSNYCGKALANKKEIVISMDFLPDFEEENLLEMIKPLYLLNADKSLKDFLSGTINDKLCQYYFKRAGLTGEEITSSLDLKEIIDLLLQFKKTYLVVKEIADFPNAQITIGGISTKDLTEYFEVKQLPGLYVVGELVDVSGPCGGYNLQWAFTSGAIAGEAACC